ncbi:MAG: penicillin acylase family protein [Spirochaetota bacterium]
MQHFHTLILSLVLWGTSGCSLLSIFNAYQTEGKARLLGLRKPVKVFRDEKGMAYVYGKNLYDVIKGQGYTTAQDRLFQMQLTKTLIRGELAKYFGKRSKPSDIKMRTLGFYRAAKKHASILNEETKQLLQAYADGVNQYIKNVKDEHPFELNLAKLKLDPWTPVDSLAIMYYMGWGSAANLKHEILTQMLVEKLGFTKAMTISPVNVNPDEKSPLSFLPISLQKTKLFTSKEKNTFHQDPLLKSILNDANSLQMGSNNWVVKGDKSLGTKPIVVNDPHLVTKTLPSIFYPIGLITPSLRVVGANVPGIPSILVGRNEYVAAGVTNQYGDAQDIYIETVDPKNPSNYLEGKNSIPFQTIEETLYSKDKESINGFTTEKITIRLTKRGPVISKVLHGIKTDKVLTVRWATLENMRPSLGIDFLLKAKSVDDVRKELDNYTFINLNYVFADTQGNIGWQTTGKLPIRSKGNGMIPLPVTDSKDNWSGWIPYEEMPHSYNPARGWVGTANHKTVTKDYPYYYSNMFAPKNRYQRVSELLDAPGQKTAEEHWQFLRDDLNVTAREVAPILAKALIAKEETKQIGKILSQWNFKETTKATAPSIYHETYRNLVVYIFKDELGEELLSLFLKRSYYWQERLGLMLQQGDSTWFDDTTTPNQKETLIELIQKAGLQTIKDLSQKIGSNPEEWYWGKIHQIEFVNPIRRKGIGKDWLGGGKHPMAGSGDTIYRARFPLDKKGNMVEYSATLRMVVDLNDREKIIAVSPGGTSGRTFTAHFDDQIEAYLSGEKMHWWFSDEKIKQHAKSQLILEP